ncbi:MULTISPECIES: hypothetical protein [unclassified Variovorax]|uniref:PIN-like domain-containing protein n=1 Tax=unclassified Variovorax TaxID=663243 RepID=UPI002B22A770|nr:MULTISPECIES: hypothetical protein [unclassified Variovorax]MEB0058610.1 hypothetical protein [Variovorax sp. LG9.2]MEB0112087.1 hypothetical protein [Variovorax sp. RTB1]
MVADQSVLFIDRCAWSGKLGAALDAAGIPYVPHNRHFKHDTPDEVWLTAVKDNGWLILTRDQRIRYRINEHRALVEAKLMMFVLSQGGLTAEETGRIVCAAYPEIVRQANVNQPPALFSITRSGEVSRRKLSA